MQEAGGRLAQATQRLARQISEDFENGRRAARADVERLAMKWAEETKGVMVRDMQLARRIRGEKFDNKTV